MIKCINRFLKGAIGLLQRSHTYRHISEYIFAIHVTGTEGSVYQHSGSMIDNVHQAHSGQPGRMLAVSIASSRWSICNARPRLVRSEIAEITRKIYGEEM